MHIIYRDEHLLAINKPSGLLVHRSEIDRHETQFAVQLVRDQIGQHVFPVHRLDKPTSGILLFALNAGCAKSLGDIFARHALTKTYLAVVRGIAPDYGIIDHPLAEELDQYSDKKAQQNKPVQTAITKFQRLADIELPVAIDKYPTSRFSLVECTPRTGRKHQLRRHLKHINHPIIGDAKHGKGRHNRFFQDEFSCGRLLLAATQLEFIHPIHCEKITIVAPLDKTFSDLLKQFGWHHAIPARWLSEPELPLCV